MVEKRTQERFFLNLQAKITYRHIDDHQPPVIDTVAANISGGGVFLETSHPFPMAAKVAIEFLISLDDLKKLRFILSVEALRKISGNQVWISTTGIVVRRDECGIAVIFDTDYQITPVHTAPSR